MPLLVGWGRTARTPPVVWLFGSTRDTWAWLVEYGPSSDQLNGRIASLRPDDSPAKIIEDTGIKGKSVKIVPIKGEERSGFIEDAADIRIEGLTLNEAVNLLYRLEKGSRPLVIKKYNLRVRFDDPSRCDLSLIQALLKPAPGQAK